VVFAAGHAESSNPGCCHPAGPLVDAFHVLSVTTVPSLAITLAGLAVVLVAAIASVLVPIFVGTVIVVARFHESTTRRDALSASTLQRDIPGLRDAVDLARPRPIHRNYVKFSEVVSHRVGDMLAVDTPLTKDFVDDMRAALA